MLFRRNEKFREFEKFFIEYYPRTRAFARKLLMSEQDAEDVVQDIFLKLMDKPDIWRDKQKRDKFLFTMIRNHIFNLIKHRKVEQRFRSNMQTTHAISSDLGMEERMNEKEVELIIMNAVERMPEQRRVIFKLSRFQSKSHGEIAQTLGLSVRTVERHIYLALAELKKTLKNYVPVE